MSLYTDPDQSYLHVEDYTRIKKLECLLAAATRFTFEGPGGWYVAEPCIGRPPMWEVFTVNCRSVSRSLSKDEAIALARMKAGL